MRRNATGGELGQVSELAIVDTFTKLIFGEESGFSSRELSIIHALRLVECNISMDCHRDMGIYLRALGVREMIDLVAAVRGQLVSATPALTTISWSGSSQSRSHPR